MKKDTIKAPEIQKKMPLIIPLKRNIQINILIAVSHAK